MEAYAASKYCFHDWGELFGLQNVNKKKNMSEAGIVQKLE